MADRQSSRFGRPNLVAFSLLFLSLFLNIATATPLPNDIDCKEPLTARNQVSITQPQYEAYLQKYFKATDKYILYTGGSAEQVENFQKKNPGYYYYNDFYDATTNPKHPWYDAFNEETQMDDGEASSMAISAVATKQILVFGAAEYQTKGARSFYTTKEVDILKQRIKAGELPHITHMAKDATSPTDIMATEDADGKFTYKPGYKAGDTNASGAYGICKRASSTCDTPPVFKNNLGSKTKSKTTKTT